MPEENKKEYEFTYGWCDMCGCVFVRCPKCGNNSCNAGYGIVDGEKCDVCPLAYQYQKMFWTIDKEICSHFLKPSPTVAGWCSLLRKGIGDGAVKEVEDKGLLRCPCDKFSELTEPEHVEDVPLEQDDLLKKVFGVDNDRNE